MAHCRYDTIMQRLSLVLFAIAFAAVATAARLDPTESTSAPGLPASKHEEAHGVHQYEFEHGTALDAKGDRDVVSSTKGWWHPFGCQWASK